MKYLSHTITLVLVFVSLSFNSCTDIEDFLDQTLSNDEIIEGLKSALQVGTDTSVTQVSKMDGFFADQVIKILIPEKAQTMIDYLNYIPGGQSLIDNFVLSMNRAAEDAAVLAKPIFIDAITGMTIADGLEILTGEDTAATHYLRENTFDQLFTAFKPSIQQSLDKGLVAGLSANDSWTQLSSAYNNYVVDSWVGTFYGLTPVEIELDRYVTHKALDGVFVKIADEESDIRNNPQYRINDILQKVFGSQDQ